MHSLTLFQAHTTKPASAFLSPLFRLMLYPAAGFCLALCLVSTRLGCAATHQSTIATHNCTVDRKHDSLALHRDTFYW